MFKSKFFLKIILWFFVALNGYSANLYINPDPLLKTSQTTKEIYQKIQEQDVPGIEAPSFYQKLCVNQEARLFVENKLKDFFDTSHFLRPKFGVELFENIQKKLTDNPDVSVFKLEASKHLENLAPINNFNGKGPLFWDGSFFWGEKANSHALTGGTTMTDASNLLLVLQQILQESQIRNPEIVKYYPSISSLNEKDFLEGLHRRALAAQILDHVLNYKNSSNITNKSIVLVTFDDSSEELNYAIEKALDNGFFVEVIAKKYSKKQFFDFISQKYSQTFLLRISLEAYGDKSKHIESDSQKYLEKIKNEKAFEKKQAHIAIDHGNTLARYTNISLVNFLGQYLGGALDKLKDVGIDISKYEQNKSLGTSFRMASNYLVKPVHPVNTSLQPASTEQGDALQYFVLPKGASDLEAAKALKAYPVFEGFDIALQAKDNKEFYVDHSMHFFLLKAIIERGHRGDLMVIFSGDGNANDKQTSFISTVRLALDNGFDVAVISNPERINKVYKQTFTGKESGHIFQPREIRGIVHSLPIQIQFYPGLYSAESSTFSDKDNLIANTLNYDLYSIFTYIKDGIFKQVNNYIKTINDNHISLNKNLHTQTLIEYENLKKDKLESFKKENEFKEKPTTDDINYRDSDKYWQWVEERKRQEGLVKKFELDFSKTFPKYDRTLFDQYKTWKTTPGSGKKFDWLEPTSELGNYLFSNENNFFNFVNKFNKLKKYVDRFNLSEDMGNIASFSELAENFSKYDDYSAKNKEYFNGKKYVIFVKNTKNSNKQWQDILLNLYPYYDPAFLLPFIPEDIKEGDFASITFFENFEQEVKNLIPDYTKLNKDFNGKYKIIIIDEEKHENQNRRFTQYNKEDLENHFKKIEEYFKSSKEIDENIFNYPNYFTNKINLLDTPNHTYIQMFKVKAEILSKNHAYLWKMSMEDRFFLGVSKLLQAVKSGQYRVAISDADEFKSMVSSIKENEKDEKKIFWSSLEELEYVVNNYAMPIKLLSLINIGKSRNEGPLLDLQKAHADRFELERWGFLSINNWTLENWKKRNDYSFFFSLGRKDNDLIPNLKYKNLNQINLPRVELFSNVNKRSAWEKVVQQFRKPINSVSITGEGYLFNSDQNTDDEFFSFVKEIKDNFNFAINAYIDIDAKDEQKLENVLNTLNNLHEHKILKSIYVSYKNGELLAALNTGLKDRDINKVVSFVGKNSISPFRNKAKFAKFLDNSIKYTDAEGIENIKKAFEEYWRAQEKPRQSDDSRWNNSPKKEEIIQVKKKEPEVKISLDSPSLINTSQPSPAEHMTAPDCQLEEVEPQVQNDSAPKQNLITLFILPKKKFGCVGEPDKTWLDQEQQSLMAIYLHDFSIGEVDGNELNLVDDVNDSLFENWDKDKAIGFVASPVRNDNPTAIPNKLRALVEKGFRVHFFYESRSDDLANGFAHLPAGAGILHYYPFSRSTITLFVFPKWLGWNEQQAKFDRVDEWLKDWHLNKIKNYCEDSIKCRIDNQDPQILPLDIASHFAQWEQNKAIGFIWSPSNESNGYVFREISNLANKGIPVYLFYEAGPGIEIFHKDLGNNIFLHILPLSNPESMAQSYVQ